VNSTTSESASIALRRQRGAALIVAMVVLVLLASAILLDRLNAAVAPSPSRDPASVEALAEAKQALIAWAATHPDTPGLLPFPDRNDDGAYDGAADCISPGPVAAGHLLGRFPIQGEQAGCTTSIGMSMDVVDSAGERLWYAVSRNLVRGGAGGPINPDLGDLAAQPWITVRDQTGGIISPRVAAVIIAPGPSLSGQDRENFSTDPAVEYPKYLESITIGPDTFSNADADGCLDDNVGCGVPEAEDFIIYPNTVDMFNDRLVFITVDELMRAVEDRVLGEAVRALGSYRNSYTVAAPYYPWMSTFSTPRTPQGVATGGSITTLVDAGTDFVAAGVSATGGVTATTLTLEGLIGGTGNTFTVGDGYVVHASDKFLGDFGATEGMLPLHYPNEVFQTGFTVNWNYSGEKNDDVGGDPSLQPTVAEVDGGGFGDLTVPENQGACKWTQSNRVDCRGWAFLPGAGTGGSNRTVEVWFNFTAQTTTIVAPTGTDVRRRNHTYSGTNYGWVTALAAPDLPQETWTIRITDDDGILTPGWRLAVRDLDTDLVISKFEGIRYEIDVPNELPVWFVENNWHHFVHTAISGANLPATASTSGDGNCTTPPLGAGNEDDDCLTVEYNLAMVRDDVEAVVIGPGAALTVLPQDRNTATACTSQPAFMCDYFESPNSTDYSPAPRNLVFGRALGDTFSVSGTFNDQIRTVPP
jgi:hypothetical protein